MSFEFLFHLKIMLHFYLNCYKSVTFKKIADQCLIQSSSERLPLAADGNRCRDPQPDFMWRESLNWRSPSNPSPRVQGTLWKREGEESKSQRGGGHLENKASQSTKQGAYELTEIEAESKGPTWVYTRSLSIYDSY